MKHNEHTNFWSNKHFHHNDYYAGYYVGRVNLIQRNFSRGNPSRFNYWGARHFRNYFCSFINQKFICKIIFQNNRQNTGGIIMSLHGGLNLMLVVFLIFSLNQVCAESNSVMAVFVWAVLSALWMVLITLINPNLFKDED